MGERVRWGEGEGAPRREWMRLRDQHRERESRGERGRRLGESGCGGE